MKYDPCSTWPKILRKGSWAYLDVLLIRTWLYQYATSRGVNSLYFPLPHQPFDTADCQRGLPDDQNAEEHKGGQSGNRRQPNGRACGFRSKSCDDPSKLFHACTSSDLVCTQPDPPEHNVLWPYNIICKCRFCQSWDIVNWIMPKMTFSAEARGREFF